MRCISLEREVFLLSRDTMEKALFHVATCQTSDRVDKERRLSKKDLILVGLSKFGKIRTQS